MKHYFVDEDCLTWSDPDMYIFEREEKNGYFARGTYFRKRKTALKYLRRKLAKDIQELTECIKKIDEELEK